jgi:hypothetical protein
MKKPRLLPLFLSTVLVLGSASPAFAQTLTLDTTGPDYSGDVLMTLNTRINFKDEADFNTSWEATGVPGAGGVSEPAATAAAQSTDAEIDGIPTDRSALRLENAESLQTQDSESETYKEEDTKTFHSRFYYGFTPSTETPDKDFEAKCVAVTEHCTLWVDQTQGFPSHYSEEEITGLARIYEEHAVTMLNTFGDSSRLDVDKDGRIAIVFYPFNQTHYMGFFSPNDLDRNQMDMINMNTYAFDANDKAISLGTQLGVTFHEWQHLINCSQTLDRSDSWLNESFSQSALCVNGFEGIGLASQTIRYNTFMESYSNSLTVPFAFQDAYVPGTQPLAAGVYINWYLFGRYLSAQTEGYTGGGDEIYKSVFSAIQNDFLGYENVGYCTNQSLTAALTKMGYIGTGADAKAGNLNEMLRNFVIATAYRQNSGVYALGNYGSVDLSGIDTAKLDTAAQTPQNLPGGYSAAFTKIDGSSITTGASGDNIQHVGITVHYDGVQADSYSPTNGAMAVAKDTPITLSTTDTNVTIRYTTDGTDPTADTGTVYTGPITIEGNTTIKALDFDKWGASSVNTFTYTVSNTAADSNGAASPNAKTGIDAAHQNAGLAAAAALLLASLGLAAVTVARRKNAR